MTDIQPQKVYPSKCMNLEKTHLYATLSSGEEVRHLLIDFVDGSHVTNLVQLTAGSETQIATGTEYEMTQKVEELVQLWVTQGGFKHHLPDVLVHESLVGAV